MLAFPGAGTNPDSTPSGSSERPQVSVSGLSYIGRDGQYGRGWMGRTEDNTNAIPRGAPEGTVRLVSTPRQRPEGPLVATPRISERLLS